MVFERNENNGRDHLELPLICLGCGNPLITINSENIYYCSQLHCNMKDIRIDTIRNLPVLIDFNSSVVSEDILKSTNGISDVPRRDSSIKNILKKILPKNNSVVQRNVGLIMSKLQNISQPKILVIGGGEIGNGMEPLYNKYSQNIISFDIYYSPRLDFIGDAHQIPLADQYFDLVIIQAVLEHVVEPLKVVNEIWRVLKTKGLVYAETPFMQQVHEGKYDFTRFTESGHRYLFRRFQLEKSGVLQGVGTTLLWSLDYFFSGLFRIRIVGKIIRILFFWLPFIDRIIPKSYNVDGASGVFFLGKKSDGVVTSKEIIEFYSGSQK